MHLPDLSLLRTISSPTLSGVVWPKWSTPYTKKNWCEVLSILRVLASEYMPTNQRPKPTNTLSCHQTIYLFNCSGAITSLTSHSLTAIPSPTQLTFRTLHLLTLAQSPSALDPLIQSKEYGCSAYNYSCFAGRYQPSEYPVWLAAVVHTHSLQMFCPVGSSASKERHAGLTVAWQAMGFRAGRGGLRMRVHIGAGSVRREGVAGWGRDRARQ